MSKKDEQAKSSEASAQEQPRAPLEAGGNDQATLLKRRVAQLEGELEREVAKAGAAATKLEQLKAENDRLRTLLGQTNRPPVEGLVEGEYEVATSVTVSGAKGVPVRPRTGDVVTVRGPAAATALQRRLGTATRVFEVSDAVLAELRDGEFLR